MVKNNMKKFDKKYVYAVVTASAVAVFSVAALAIPSVANIGIFSTDFAVTAGNLPDSIDAESSATQTAPTGTATKMTVYILPVSEHTHASAAIERISAIIPGMDASYTSTLGASPNGLYTDELAPSPVADPPNGIEKGEMVTMRVFKTTPDAVKIYIDPDVKKADGTSVTVADISEDYLFGNGISCCGITLKDGTDVNVVFFVVDQAQDSAVMQKLDEMKNGVR